MDGSQAPDRQCWDSGYPTRPAWFYLPVYIHKHKEIEQSSASNVCLGRFGVHPEVPIGFHQNLRIRLVSLIIRGYICH
jgi:hypothetical protein